MERFMKKSILSCLFFVLISTIGFAGNYSTVTYGFGFGLSGLYQNANMKIVDGASSASGLIRDETESGKLLAFNPLDVEGRIIFNKSNVALMTRLAFGFGKLSVGSMLDDYKDDFAYNLDFLLGVGYRFQPTDTVSIIPSLVTGSYMTIFAENETNSTGTTDSAVGIYSLQFGFDITTLVQLTRRVYFEFSTLFTTNVWGNGAYIVETNKLKATSIIAVKPGCINIAPKVGIVWLF